MCLKITTQKLLAAYVLGYFPMAENQDAKELSWHKPEWRSIIPLSHFKISKSLLQVIKKNIFEIKINTNFREVITQCANRNETWISEEIIDLYTSAFEKGHAMSVECYQNNELVGGLYGIKIHHAFFGESMFSKVSNASKVALVFLVDYLRKNNYRLLDTQYINEHTAQFGAMEIPVNIYEIILQDALAGFNIQKLYKGDWDKWEDYLEFNRI